MAHPVAAHEADGGLHRRFDQRADKGRRRGGAGPKPRLPPSGGPARPSGGLYPAMQDLWRECVRGEEADSVLGVPLGGSPRQDHHPADCHGHRRADLRDGHRRRGGAQGGLDRANGNLRHCADHHQRAGGPRLQARAALRQPLEEAAGLQPALRRAGRQADSGDRRPDCRGRPHVLQRAHGRDHLLRWRARLGQRREGGRERTHG
mmetsp:Transcript_58175/g.165405  ORF Transcript_58175/g.165405 Transcript_58175/m.165405 type:complete len:205 (-) Transcript_58175:823-1437(-)